MSNKNSDKPEYTRFGTRINKNIRSHTNDPHVIEKMRCVQEMVRKTGLPELPEKKKK